MVLLAAFGLAACGGGGGGTATEPPPTQAELDAAKIAELQGQIAALRAQLGLAPDASLSDSIADLQQQAADLRKRLQDEQDDARKAAMAMAMKLHAGIVARNTTEGNDERNAEYAGTNDADIMVTIGSGEGNETTLKENKKATVAANHGWTGKAYADPAGGDSYMAHVYSNVGEPKQGRKFASTAAVTTEGAYEYQLTAQENTEVAIDTSGEGVAARVASSSFDQSAGTKTFTRGANLQRIMISGTYHGVAGTYNCAPTGDGAAANQCTATVATKGFTLAGGTWTFKASNNEARVMSVPDTAYASYGWWLKKSADGKTYTASAFTDNKGTAPTALEISNLRGTATYMGGAAGKYALYSSTGGTNDAGHFTARAMLSATFAEDHKISGTIDNFIGADGMSRNWSVKLNETDVSDTGVIDGLSGNENNVEVRTVWTIDGTAAAKSGQWRGNLQEAGKDGVPGVATGTFYSEYNGSGKIVGAFGANKQ